MTYVSNLIARAMHRDTMRNVDEGLNFEVWLHDYVNRHHCTSPRQFTMALHDLEEDWWLCSGSVRVNEAQV